MLKQQGLTEFCIKKEEKKLEIIKDILANKSSSKFIKKETNPVNENSVYDVKTLANNIIDLKVFQTELLNKESLSKVLQLQEKLVAQVMNSDSFELIDVINKIKNVVLLFIPIIEKDQITTESVYDILTEICEYYKSQHVSMTQNQYSLKLKLKDLDSQSEKITIDDRDKFNIFLSTNLKETRKKDENEENEDKEDKEDKVNSKEIFELSVTHNHLALLERNLINSQNAFIRGFYDFNKQLESKVFGMMKLWSKLSPTREVLLGTNYLMRKNTLWLDIKETKEGVIRSIQSFLIFVKKVLYYNTEKKLNIFEVVYLYLFNQNKLASLLRIK